MRRIRARLVVVSVALLLAQVGVAVSSLAACCSEAPAAADVMECCRGGDTNHICPIGTKSAEGGCRLRAGCDQDQGGLLAAAAWSGDVPGRVEIALLPPASPAPSWSSDVVPTWFQLPPTPPPRG